MSLIDQERILAAIADEIEYHKEQRTGCRPGDNVDGWHEGALQMLGEYEARIIDGEYAPAEMWSRLLHRLVSVQVLGMRALTGTVEEITPEAIVLVEEGAPVMIPKVAIAWVHLPAAWRDAPEARRA